jgi:transposase-like protein
MTVDALLIELFRLEAHPPVRPEGRTAGILRDLWLGGVPLPRAAIAAGLTVKAAEQTLRSLGLLPVEPASSTRDGCERVEPAPKRRRRNWNASRGDVVRLYEAGRSIRAVAAELGMHQREVWRQLSLAGVSRRPRGTAGVVLSRRRLECLYVRDGLSVAEVARRFDVTKEVVNRNIARHGIPRRQRRAPLDRGTLHHLYVDERLGVRTVAARLGVSPDTVRAELARHQIPIRRPGRPARVA